MHVFAKLSLHFAKAQNRGSPPGTPPRNSVFKLLIMLGPRTESHDQCHHIRFRNTPSRKHLLRAPMNSSKAILWLLRFWVEHRISILQVSRFGVRLLTPSASDGLVLSDALRLLRSGERASRAAGRAPSCSVRCAAIAFTCWVAPGGLGLGLGMSGRASPLSSSLL